jgi:predicted Rossmann fold nucleotide-binding protein DprA/Smf involved in DNA uptake
MQELSQSTQAILLLTSSFSKYDDIKLKPLSPSEWGVFALWLHANNLKPEDLLENNIEEILQDWEESEIPLKRIIYLLERGAALALAIEKWQRIGLWVITRSDKDYPKLIKKKLQKLSPPILYGIGNKNLLNLQSIAVVGSRNADKENLQYAYELGKKIAEDGFSLVSGGAKGIDDKAMQGTLNNFGTGIIILADNLLKNSISAKYRNALREDQLVLISPYYPEATFNVGNSMARNKYIYTIANAGIVVKSNKSGGTWSGANEALKNKWIPIWTKDDLDKDSANKLLIKSGSNILTNELLQSNICELTNIIKKQEQKILLNIDSFEKDEIKSTKINNLLIEKQEELSFFEFFMYKLRKKYSNDDIFKPKDLENFFKLKPAQVTYWISHAEKVGKVMKLDGRIKKYKLKSNMI